MWKWIRRHWPLLAGIVTSLPSIIKGVAWLIGQMGSVDFVLSRIEDPSWVGRMYNLFVDPPGYLLLPLLLAGLGLIYWDTRRSRARNLRAPAPAEALASPLPVQGQPPPVTAPQPLQTVKAPPPSMPAAPVPASKVIEGEPGPAFIDDVEAIRVVRFSKLGRSRLAPTLKVGMPAAGSFNKLMGVVDPAEEENERQFTDWCKLAIEYFESDEKESIRQVAGRTEYDRATLISWLDHRYERELIKKFPPPTRW